MFTIKAGWALLGKYPGSFDDYAVIAASSWPFGATQFQKIIFGYSPGNPPASREARADALPWVSFSSATLRNTNFVGIAVRDWSDHVDGTNRPIAFTRYFCIQLDEIDDASSTFTDLYHAVRDIELPWEVADPLGGDPLELQLPDANPAAVAQTVENVGLERAAAIAAALFEGPVAVLGGATDLAERLQFLDAVAALLPLGARAWLSASSWADSGAKHRLSLSFTQRGRVGDRRATERGDYEGPQDETAQRYRGELVRLSREKGTATVARHLATLVSHRKQQADEAVDGLADLDLSGVVLQHAHDKTLRPEHVRRLGAAGRFNDLSEENRCFVLSCYLTVAGARDLEADLELLVEQWLRDLDAHLVHVTRHRLWQSHWPVAHLARFAAVADRVDAREVFTEVLIPLDSDSTRSRAGLVIAAALVAHLDTEWSDDKSLMATMIRVPPVAVAVLRQYLTTAPDVATSWLHRLEWSARSHPASQSWTAVRNVFRAVLLDESGVVDAQEITALAQLDPSVVPELMLACRVGPKDRLERLLRGALPWLGHQVSKFNPFQRESWMKELTRLTPTTQEQEAEVDLLFYRLGRNPTRDPVQAAHDGRQPRTEYIDSFVRHVWQADLPDDEHLKLVDNLARRLGTGWSSPESRFAAVLDLLWEVSHSPDGTLSRVTTSLLDAVIRELENGTDLLDHQAFERWRRRYSALQRGIPLARLRDMPAGASVAVFADSIVRLLTDGCREEEVISAIQASKYRISIEQAPNLIQEITVRMHRAGHPEAYMFSCRLGRLIVVDIANSMSKAEMKVLFSDTLTSQVMLEIYVLREVTINGDDAMRRALPRRLEELEQAHQRLGETIALIAKQRNQSSSGKKLLSILGRGLGLQQPDTADSAKQRDAE